MTPSSVLRTSKAIPAVAILIALCVAAAHAEDIKFGGTGAALGTMRVLADAYVKQQTGASFTVLPSMGSEWGHQGRAGRCHPPSASVR